MTTLFIWWNLMFPYIDLVYTLAFIPGLVLALLPWARVLRTVGVALVVVAVSGGSVLLVWGTPFVIAVQRQ